MRLRLSARLAARTAALAWILSYPLSALPVASAGDWPQILGPNRNGSTADESLSKSWPKGGPEMQWSREVGSGFAGVAVVGDQAILFHRQRDEELVESLSMATGKPSWTAKFSTEYTSQISSDDGPRCVPLIHDGLVYVYGARRNLHCIQLKDGEVVWSRDLFKDYTSSQEEGYFGAGSTPILEDGKLLVNLGAAERKAGLLALDPATGKTLWQATEELASYSSPVAATIDGVRQVIFVTRFHVMGVRAENGDVLWTIPFGARGPTVNAASPTLFDGHVLVTASYNVGALYAKVSGSKPEVVWKSDVISSQFTTCVEHEGAIYGIDGRDDVGDTRLRAFHPETGKLMWTKEDFGKANLILARDKILAMKTSGELVLFAADAREYRELANARIFNTKTYALPALSNGCLLVRDSRTLKCLRVGAGP